MASSRPATTVRRRQPLLLEVENPVTLKLGAKFFRSLPSGPGVYFFHDAADALLYIGQSGNLRARIGSYRHVTPDRHARRTLRLMRRVERIEWQECATAADAVELERVLLLERRPPFNRAGVWQGPPWWFEARAESGHLCARISREPLEGEGVVGPLPSSFRYVYATLMRAAFRVLHPDAVLAEFPLGMLQAAAPVELSWPTPRAEAMARLLLTSSRGEAAELAHLVEVLPQAPTADEREFWAEELKRLMKFGGPPDEERYLPPPTAAAAAVAPTLDW